MRVLGVIPARWGSTRLPGKSLVDIAGKPLIQWVVENARRAKRLDDLVVATDDERIVAAVQKIGARAVMTQPDHPSGTDRIAEAVAGVPGEIIINIQGDEPLLDPALVDRLAARMAEGDWDMATAATPISQDRDRQASSVVKVVWDETGRALYFSRSLIPFVRDPLETDQSGLHWRHIGIYAYQRTFLQRLVQTPPTALEKAEKLEQLRALHLGGRILVLQTEEAGIGVDTPEDVNYVAKLIRARPL